MINDKIDLRKCKNVYDIAGCCFWQYERYQNQIKWVYEENEKPYIINTNTNETIKHFINIKKYITMNNLELEK